MSSGKNIIRGRPTRRLPFCILNHPFPSIYALVQSFGKQRSLIEYQAGALPRESGIRRNFRGNRVFGVPLKSCPSVPQGGEDQWPMGRFST